MENYTDLNTWIELSKVLERGKFDALFLADVVGVYDVFRGNREAALTQAAQTPVNDPMLLVPAMAAATEHLGFAFTSSIFQYHPFTFARLISTLDHLTKGRVAWNIVTSYLESTGRSYGRSGLVEHDERYDMADEYCEVCYKLWESSWEDGAVVKDRQRGIYADPTKVRNVVHAGKYYKVDGCHLSEPSLQRTPVLYQAGASPRGQAFAARHAECVFIASPTPDIARQIIQATRKKAEQNGRNPEDILFFAYLKVITGGTEAEAKKKYDDYFEQISYDGAMALLSGWAGYDFGKFDPDEPLEYIETNAVRTLWNSFTRADPDRKWTVRDLAKSIGIGGGGPVAVGTPEQIADEFQRWIQAGVDGFNLAYAVTPGTFEDFVDGVVPVLQQRGMMQTEYQDGTLREKIYGAGHARLSPPHPAAQYRRSASASAPVSSQPRQDDSASVAVAK
jgi:FMN-dependent oxidoreductase (nitrilotriacetate monooxygenase family)